MLDNGEWHFKDVEEFFKVLVHLVKMALYNKKLGKAVIAKWTGVASAAEFAARAEVFFNLLSRSLHLMLVGAKLGPSRP